MFSIHRPPHGYSGELVEFLLFALTKIEELCKGLGIEDLPHYSGKERLCSHCDKIMFQTLKEVEGAYVLACSCKRKEDLESELKKEFNDPSYRLGEWSVTACSYDTELKGTNC